MVVSRGKKWGTYYKLPPTDYYWEIRIRRFSTVYDKDSKPEFPKPAEYYLASPDPKYPTYWQDNVVTRKYRDGHVRTYSTAKALLRVLQHQFEYVPFSISSKNKTWWEDFIEYNDFEISHLVAMICDLFMINGYVYNKHRTFDSELHPNDSRINEFGEQEYIFYEP